MRTCIALRGWRNDVPLEFEILAAGKGYLRVAEGRGRWNSVK